MQNLVIVESPVKAKTIEKFLGKGFKVEASYGHVRDLPKAELGINTEEDFEPKYVIPTKARKRINLLKKEVEKAKELYLATDLDREGEAIAWHITEVTKPKSAPKRVIFSEITKDAILEAFNHPRDLDTNLIDAQQARRILDRLVGYKLSPLLWKKVRRGLSAGRVQSVALRLIVEREREVQDFKSEEYWNIEVNLSKKEKPEENLIAKLTEMLDKKIEKFTFQKQEDVKKILDDFNNAIFIVNNIEKKQRVRNPYPPFITSTLQQEASRRLGFSAKKTMVIAQQLYEGVIMGNEGSIGLITYMRTDSLNLSSEFIERSVNLVKEKFGSNYVEGSGRRFKTKAKLAQEAHEAIRPTYIEREPSSIKNFLTPDQFKLYSLIYNRALASQMKEALFEVTSVKIKAKQYGFLSSGSRLLFDGFLKVYQDKKEEKENIMPSLETDEELDVIKIDSIQSFTVPPARYSEASLVKTMEENGIGRPSTYAPIMSTIIDRGYTKKENGYFFPQEIGFIVNDLLVSNFPNIFDIKFTAQIEEEFDEIAAGKEKWKKVIADFYQPFSKDLESKHEEIEKIKLPEVETDIKCEKCGKPMLIKIGRYGKFLACAGFPECKNTKPLVKEIEATCPRCSEKLVEKRTRKGRIFYGCSSYPSCNFASWNEPLNEQCKKCGSLLVRDKKGNVLCVDCDLKMNNPKE